jgi:DNA-binding GntR family transcriptional regulator
MLRRYQVARASLREALRILETHGLIRIKPGPGGGPVVSNGSTADFGRMATLFFQVAFAALVIRRKAGRSVPARAPRSRAGRPGKEPPCRAVRGPQ